MQTKTDVSYGVIPLIKDEEGWKVLLINQISQRGDVYWTLPKGHPEEEESPEETALRELTEETGVAVEPLDDTKQYVQNYTFIHEDIYIEKTVTYFLGFAKNKEVAIQEEEVKEVQWLLLEDALKKLTHTNAQKMLARVVKDLV